MNRQVAKCATASSENLASLAISSNMDDHFQTLLLMPAKHLEPARDVVEGNDMRDRPKRVQSRATYEFQVFKVVGAVEIP